MSDKQKEKSEKELAAIRAWFALIQDKLGKRAELRRCETLQDVYFCQGFHDLLLFLSNARQNAETDSKDSGFSKHKLDRLALLAGTLAIMPHWMETKDSMGKAFANPGGSAMSLSPLRFRRLLTCTEPAELLSPLRRATRVIKFQYSANSLSKSLLFWNDTTRKNWALDYYQNLKQEKK